MGPGTLFFGFYFVTRAPKNNVVFYTISVLTDGFKNQIEKHYSVFALLSIATPLITTLTQPYPRPHHNLPPGFHPDNQLHSLPIVLAKNQPVSPVVVPARSHPKCLYPDLLEPPPHSLRHNRTQARRRNLRIIPAKNQALNQLRNRYLDRQEFLRPNQVNSRNQRRLLNQLSVLLRSPVTSRFPDRRHSLPQDHHFNLRRILLRNLHGNPRRDLQGNLPTSRNRILPGNQLHSRLFFPAKNQARNRPRNHRADLCLDLAHGRVINQRHSHQDFPQKSQVNNHQPNRALDHHDDHPGESLSALHILLIIAVCFVFLWSR